MLNKIRKQSATISVDPDILNAFDDCCMKNKQKRSDVVAEFMVDYIEKNSK